MRLGREVRQMPLGLPHNIRTRIKATPFLLVYGSKVVL